MSTELRQLEATGIAIEHVLWAAEKGLTPRQVLADAGIEWPRRSSPSWHDCVHGLAVAWRRLAWVRPASSPAELRRAA